MTSASDRLTLVVLGSFALAALVGGASLVVVLPLVAIAAGVFAVATLRSRFGRILHDVAIVAWIATSFEAIGPIITAVREPRYDAELSAVDDGLLAPVASGWTNAFARPALLTDALSVAYASFYAFPVVVALALYVHGRIREYREVVFAVALAFYVPFFGYLAIPATGPRVPPELAATVLGGGGVAEAVRTFLGVVEKNLFDAFPSGHTSVSIVVLACGWTTLPRWRVPLAIIATAIVFSTVYLSFHYVVDVVAGIVVAAIVVPVAPRLHAVFAGELGRHERCSFRGREGEAALLSDRLRAARARGMHVDARAR